MNKLIQIIVFVYIILICGIGIAIDRIRYEEVCMEELERLEKTSPSVQYIQEKYRINNEICKNRVSTEYLKRIWVIGVGGNKIFSKK